ncbi:MAG: family 10 glycosylhydrolase [Bryobacteraceae bacterium]
MASRREFLQTAAAAAFPAPLARAAESVYLADFDKCLPASALARGPQPRRWRLLSYESDNARGFLLVAGQNTDAPEIRYRFSQKGWHAVSIGLCTLGHLEHTSVQIRLKSDRTFCVLNHTQYSKPDARRRIDDFFWKYADVTGEELVIRTLKRGPVWDGAWIAYLKLTPLSEAEVAEVKRDRARKDTRRLYAHNDAFTYAARVGTSTAGEIAREIEPLRDTDFSRLYWEVGDGDNLYYPSKLAPAITGALMKDPHRLADKLHQESHVAYERNGIHPAKVAIEAAHSLGLEFHACWRPAGFHYPPPHEDRNPNGLYDQHPEWRSRDRLGRPTPRLSYAYPGVRNFALSMFREVAGYPVDGVCLLYNRRPPFLEYEEPVVNSFKKQFGQDPRQLDERDERWLRHRAGVMTQFHRDLRAALPRKVQISAIVLAGAQENLYNALDVEGWVREGLVDTIIPYTNAPRIDSAADSWLDPKDYEFFLRVTRGTSCKMALSLLPRKMSPEEYRRRAKMHYDAGVENLFFWDTFERNDFSPSWSALRRLGHREEVGKPLERPHSMLRKVGDWDLSYATPG